VAQRIAEASPVSGAAPATITIRSLVASLAAEALRPLADAEPSHGASG
jgi:hypothetical protein